VVIWTEPAKADLRSIHDFIAADSRHYAKKVVQDLINKTDILDRLPRVGRVVPELSEIKGEDVFVVAVIHKRRDLQPEMVEHT
jgi:plasmid stabilization system protein ParE